MVTREQLEALRDHFNQSRLLRYVKDDTFPTVTVQRYVRDKYGSIKLTKEGREISTTRNFGRPRD
jgi:hypothetical protein